MNVSQDLNIQLFISSVLLDQISSNFARQKIIYKRPLDEYHFVVFLNRDQLILVDLNYAQLNVKPVQWCWCIYTGGSIFVQLVYLLQTPTVFYFLVSVYLHQHRSEILVLVLEFKTPK